jgi:hypothetical protein
MIQPLDDFLRALDRYVAARRLSPRRDERLIADALRLAEELSGGRAEDEPAALLFALSRRQRALGDAWEGYPLLCARNMAHMMGWELDLRLDDFELSMLRVRVAWGQAGFEEVRAWIAARRRPLR